MPLTEAEFRTRCDAALNHINRSLDPIVDKHDIEVMLQNGVLTIEVDDPNPGKIVISPQAPTRQIWISARSTSFKLDWNGNAFALAASGETLDTLVGRLVGEQLGIGRIDLE